VSLTDPKGAARHEVRAIKLLKIDGGFKLVGCCASTMRTANSIDERKRILKRGNSIEADEEEGWDGAETSSSEQ